MTVSDEGAALAMRRFAQAIESDPAIVAGESGAAGLAGLCQAAKSGPARNSLRLNATSRVLLFNTEGATDQKRYSEIVGCSPTQVLGSA